MVLRALKVFRGKEKLFFVFHVKKKTKYHSEIIVYKLSILVRDIQLRFSQSGKIT